MKTFEEIKEEFLNQSHTELDPDWKKICEIAILKIDPAKKWQCKDEIVRLKKLIKKEGDKKGSKALKIQGIQFFQRFLKQHTK